MTFTSKLKHGYCTSQTDQIDFFFSIFNGIPQTQKVQSIIVIINHRI